MKGGRLENHCWLFYDLSLQQGSVSHKEITAYKKSMQYITVSKL